MNAPGTIETERLVLRRAVVDDAQAVFDMNADPEVVLSLSRVPSTDIADTVNFLGRCDEQWDSGGSFTWAVTTGGGLVGLIAARPTRHGVELGYMVERDSWGMGYMTEAAQAVVDLAFSDDSVYRVWAYTRIDNIRSQRVLEKLGMVREGTLHRWVPQPNVSPTPADSYMYALWR